ncbi:MAG: helix-turn-helix domain-containing protein [Thermomicrobia bacterium]|nr:helix-turn-helix domain-containing protein [Thermomicrobia bacterium]
MGKKSALDDFLAEEMRDPEFRESYERISALVSFGVAVAMMREKRGMTQKQLADATGIQRSVIARLESGDHAPTLVTQTKLAQALDARLEVPPDGQVRFVPVRATTAKGGARRARTVATA